MQGRHRVGGRSPEECPVDQSPSPTAVAIQRVEPALILASASPRRHQLLGLLGIPYRVDPADVDERLFDGEAPTDAAERLALAKARLVAQRHRHAIVIGADTIVILDGQPLGKPDDDDDALRMLRSLAGQTHTVVTGLAVVGPGQEHIGRVTASVTMYTLPDEQLQAYVATGEPRDKAGAYGYQGHGGALVKSVAGCLLAVVGLPIGRLATLLIRAGWAGPIDPVGACTAYSGRPPIDGCCRQCERGEHR